MSNNLPTDKYKELKNLLYNLRFQFEARRTKSKMSSLYVKGFNDAISLIGKGVNTLEGVENSK